MKTYQKWEFLHSCAVPFTIGVVIGFVFRMISSKPYNTAFIIVECVLVTIGVIVSVISGIMRHKYWNKYIDMLRNEVDEDDRR